MTISVLEPADVTLPASIQSISVLPVPGVYSKPGVFDSITIIGLPAATNVNEIKMGYLHGIQEVLSASPRFQKVVLVDTVDSKSALKGRLYWDDINKFCKHDTTNVLLVLSKAVSYDDLDNFDVDDNQVLGDVNYKLINFTKWAFYLPEKRQELVSFLFTDTIWFQGIFGVSDLANILYESCYSSGMHSGINLCPHWKDVNRSYFKGPGKEMRTATRYVLKNQWHDAASIWDQLVVSSKNKPASRAAFNLALAFERDDMLDQASLWIAYSDSLSGNSKIEVYKKVLNDRLKTKVKLDEQMAGN